jgi:hypothetical protein
MGRLTDELGRRGKISPSINEEQGEVVSNELIFYSDNRQYICELRWLGR